MLERLLADWPVRLLALGLAFAAWVAITGEKTIVVNLDVPLDIHVGKGRTLSSQPPSQVTVRLEGPETLVGRLENERVTARIDLADALPGSHDVSLTARHLSGIPPRVDVAFFQPDRVTVGIDEARVSELPVVPDTRGVPPQGFALYSAVARPETVRVRGPASQVEGLSQLQTSPIDVSDRTRTFTVRIPVVPDRPQVQVLGSDVVEVRVLIDTAPEDRTFESVPILPGMTDYTLEVEPPTVQVTLNGPRALLDRMAARQIRVVGDLNGLQPGPLHRVALEAAIADLPAEQRLRLKVKTVEPRHLSVRLIQRAPTG